MREKLKISALFIATMAISLGVCWYVLIDPRWMLPN